MVHSWPYCSSQLQLASFLESSFLWCTLFLKILWERIGLRLWWPLRIASLTTIYRIQSRKCVCVHSCHMPAHCQLLLEYIKNEGMVLWSHSTSKQYTLKLNLTAACVGTLIHSQAASYVFEKKPSTLPIACLRALRKAVSIAQLAEES